MKRVLFVTGGFVIALAVEFGFYCAFGLYAISVGCQGISTDCYLAAAEFAKLMQSIAVAMFIVTVMLLLFYLLLCVLRLLLKK